MRTPPLPFSTPRSYPPKKIGTIPSIDHAPEYARTHSNTQPSERTFADPTRAHTAFSNIGNKSGKKIQIRAIKCYAIHCRSPSSHRRQRGQATDETTEKKPRHRHLEPKWTKAADAGAAKAPLSIADRQNAHWPRWGGGRLGARRSLRVGASAIVGDSRRTCGPPVAAL